MLKKGEEFCSAKEHLTYFKQKLLCVCDYIENYTILAFLSATGLTNDIVGFESHGSELQLRQIVWDENCVFPCNYHISSVMRQTVFFQNSPTDLDLSYKMDLDLWDC